MPSVLQVSKNKRWGPNLEEAANAVANLHELEAAMYLPPLNRAESLGFVLEGDDDEVHRRITVCQSMALV